MCIRDRSRLVTVATSLYKFTGPLGNQYNYICAGVIITLLPALIIFVPVSYTHLKQILLRERRDKTSTAHFLSINASASRAERKTGSIFLKNDGRYYYDQCHPELYSERYFW